VIIGKRKISTKKGQRGVREGAGAFGDNTVRRIEAFLVRTEVGTQEAERAKSVRGVGPDEERRDLDGSANRDRIDDES